MLIDEVKKYLEDTDWNENDIENVSRAVDYYCGESVKVFGMIEALKIEVKDLENSRDYDGEAQTQLLKMFGLLKGLKIK